MSESTTTASQAMSYVAKCRACDRLVAAVVDDPEHPERAQQEVARWARSKTVYVIERVTVEAVRTLPWRCRCGDWQCGMCQHWSPKRFRSRCQRCGAEKGMGSAAIVATQGGRNV